MDECISPAANPTDPASCDGTRKPETPRNRCRLLIILALLLFISVKTGIVIPRRWAALGCWTSFLIWIILRQYKSYLKQVKFWCVLLCLLLIHVIAFIVVLQWYPDWRLIWYVPTVVIEAQFMGAVLDTVMRNKHSNSR
jgi:hypothetical protein